MKKIFPILFLSLFLTNFVLRAQEVPETEKKELNWKSILAQREAQHIRDSIAVVVLSEQLKSIGNRNETDIVQKKLEALRKQDSLTTAKEVDTLRAMSRHATGFPVLLYGDTLFSIYTSLGPYDAQHRAADITTKIEMLYKLPHFHPDSVVFHLNKDISTISYGSTIITGISRLDALWENRPMDSLGLFYTTQIREKIVYYRENNNWTNNLKRIGWSVLIISIAIGLMYIVNRGFIKLVYKIFRNRTKYVKEVKVKSYRLFDRTHIFSAIISLLKLLRLLLLIAICYFSVQHIFSLFPLTHNWSTELLHFVESPLRKAGEHFVGYLPNLVTILIIFFAFRLLIRLLRYFAIEIERGVLNIKGFYKDWGMPTYKILRFILGVFTFILIFPYLPGSHSDAFKGVSVFLGVLITIGSSSSISNIISGIVITYMRPFRKGDWIQTEDITGVVLEKNLLVTRLRTLQNEDVTLPNSRILAGHTVNYSSTSTERGGQGLAIKVSITISYQIGWEKVTELLTKAAAQTKDVVNFPEPFVLQQNLNNFNIAYELNAYTRKPERMFFIHSELLNHIVDEFHAAGIDMISPQFIHLKKEDDDGKTV